MNLLAIGPPASLRRSIGVAFVCALVAACVTDIEVGRAIRGDSLSSEDADTRGEDASASGECVRVRCRGPVLECGDCEDNDGDGLVDEADPDCFGPCSDSERTLLGRTQPCPNDSCFFSFDCGEGNDLTCSTLIPNGCDCHGCCEIDGRSVHLGSLDGDGNPSCTSGGLTNPLACETCTLDTACLNACDDCEVCFASPTVNTSCPMDDGCQIPACPDGVEPCSNECGLRCGAGFVCVTGCCIDLTRTAAPE